MPTDSPLTMYRIPIDGHFHGGPPPKPWVARIDGVHEQYGLRREFIRALNDWEAAHRAQSGNVYGIVATFPLRDGHLYEVSRCRGSSSKRYVAREFFRLAGGKREPLEAIEALAAAEGDSGSATVLRVRETEDRPWVAEVVGVGTPKRLGFVVIDGDRHYRLREGRLYEVRELDARDQERRRFVVAQSGTVLDLSHDEALRWISTNST